MKSLILNYNSSSIIIILLISLISLHNTSPINLTATTDENKCEKISNLLINHIITHNPLPEQYADAYKLIKYSGTGLNDLGDYYACVSLPYAHYYTITIGLSRLMTQSIGICYLRECDKAYIEKSAQNLYDFLSKQIALPFKRDAIQISFPKEALKDKQSGYVLGFGIIVTLLLIEVVLMCLGSMTKMKLFFPFDIVKNAATIFNVRNKNQTYAHLRVFDGIRFFSAGWVVFGHTAYLPMMYGPKNIMDMTYLATSWYTPFMTSAYFSVDVFFFMSGFLFYFSFVNLNQSFPKIKLFCLSLLSRYCRLLPFLIFAVFGATYLLPFLSDGPNYSNVSSFNSGCLKYWWHNFLYVNNLIHYTGDAEGETMCMAHGWYLACDMQFFIYSLVIAVFFSKYKLIQHIIYALTFIFSIEWQYLQVYKHGYGFNDMVHDNASINNFFADFYIHPFARIGPYLLGIFFCELFLHTDLYINDYEKENGVSDVVSKGKIKAKDKDKDKEDIMENFSKSQDDKLNINTINVSRSSNASNDNNINNSQSKDEKINVKQESNDTSSNNTYNDNDNDNESNYIPRNQVFLYKINHYIQNNDYAAWAIFLFALFCINGSFWISAIGNKHLLSVFVSATMNTWEKIIFILGLGLIIHLTFLDRFNFIRKFLTLTIASAVSRTTYGIYIIHIYICAFFVLSYNNFYYIRIYDLFLLALGIFCVSWVLALVIGLLIESPIIVICKMFIKGDEAFAGPRRPTVKGKVIPKEQNKEQAQTQAQGQEAK